MIMGLCYHTGESPAHSFGLEQKNSSLRESEAKYCPNQIRTSKNAYYIPKLCGSKAHYKDKSHLENSIVSDHKPNQTQFNSRKLHSVHSKKANGRGKKSRSRLRQKIYCRSNEKANRQKKPNQNC